eukprot:9472786-Pyramimonas_sp.AAC.1
MAKYSSGGSQKSGRSASHDTLSTSRPVSRPAAIEKLGGARGGGRGGEGPSRKAARLLRSPPAFERLSASSGKA